VEQTPAIWKIVNFQISFSDGQRALVFSFRHVTDLRPTGNSRLSGLPTAFVWRKALTAG
jgi:hypothetical protein